MANEYINRDAVIELLVDKQRATCPCGRLGHGYVYGSDRDKYDEIEADIDKVQNIPAADVVERKRGKWIEEGGGSCVYCSECGEDFVLDEWAMDDFTNLMNFCPHCGADMKEADNG